ncbi:hypothetical protein AB0M02_08700 [Actinoplanes sp. NPDC051861]|uniref:hypothetical protein n=1 Tax=Actinoplanes sp. NPDC051861 TaxID=3155170 RepID=UPI00343CB4B9
MTADSRPPVRGYAKPVVVPDRLDLLTGPTTGLVHLPTHLKWSGNARYDLDQPGRIVDLYRTVLNEAATMDDLCRYLDRDTLVALWPSMWLPGGLRQRWEQRFPELTADSHGSVA